MTPECRLSEDFSMNRNGRHLANTEDEKIQKKLFGNEPVLQICACKPAEEVNTPTSHKRGGKMFVQNDRKSSMTCHE